MVRKNRYLPLVLLWVGLLWPIQSSLSLSAGAGGIWVYPRQVDLDGLQAGKTTLQEVWLVNVSGRSVEVQAEPTCGCTIPDFSRTVLPMIGAVRFQVQVDTTGISPGVHGRVVRLRFRAGGEEWREDILLRLHVSRSEL
ncbi:MAG: hypothetical protein C4336_02445 [Armatimonadota bacterium]